MVVAVACLHFYCRCSLFRDSSNVVVVVLVVAVVVVAVVVVVVVTTHCMHHVTSLHVSVPGPPMNLEFTRSPTTCSSIFLRWSEPSQNERNGTFKCTMVYDRICGLENSGCEFHYVSYLQAYSEATE